ncbi:MAG: hypothetical protein LQ340_005569 [Diploschistes diacapsis]|nr:MAG: hypothetical protein LQ340_005569 [Diploschistes diacapsis]
MKSTFIGVLAAAVASVSGQYIIQNNGTITCKKAGTYCAGQSGSTNYIIHCDAAGNGGYAGNCNDNLAGYCGGVCQFAPCKQTSPHAGNAYCSVDGAIADNGTVLTGPYKRAVLFES